MKLPLIADDHGDISIFATIDAAIRYLEPVDIQRHEYEFFDADGYRVDAFLTSGKAIRLSLRQPPVQEALVLAERLKGFLGRCGRSVETNELGELVRQAELLATTV